MGFAYLFPKSLLQRGFIESRAKRQVKSIELDHDGFERDII